MATIYTIVCFLNKLKVNAGPKVIYWAADLKLKGVEVVWLLTLISTPVIITNIVTIFGILFLVNAVRQILCRFSDI